MNKDIRRSVIAGSWYPGHQKELRQTIEAFLANVKDGAVPGQLIGLIVPHAGYVYSGQIAAYAYKQLEGKHFDTVVLIGPSHRAIINGFAISSQSHYETPLGLVELDRAFIDTLEQATSTLRIRQDAEHSLEIQVPFMQVALSDFKLVPIIMGDHSLATCQQLGQTLAATIGDRSALLVASSDLSHFYPYDHAVKLDKVVLGHIDAFDPEGLSRDLDGGRCEACGGGPVVAAMLAAKALGADHAKVLKYANSGDVTGDRSSVVGYAAGAIYRSA
jgi:AmmeMemoRadiSam system protein B